MYKRCPQPARVNAHSLYLSPGGGASAAPRGKRGSGGDGGEETRLFTGVKMRPYSPEEYREAGEELVKEFSAHIERLGERFNNLIARNQRLIVRQSSRLQAEINSFQDTLPEMLEIRLRKKEEEAAMRQIAAGNVVPIRGGNQWK